MINLETLQSNIDEYQTIIPNQTEQQENGHGKHGTRLQQLHEGGDSPQTGLLYVEDLWASYQYVTAPTLLYIYVEDLWASVT